VSGVDRLVLEVTRYDGPTNWSWTLTDATGAVLADHEVSLDPAAPGYAAWTRLERHLALHVDPDRPARSEAEIVARVSGWIGGHVLGPIGSVLVDRSPVAVEVRVPPAARDLLLRPLELAAAGPAGQPLAVQDVSLVMCPPGEPGRGGWQPVGARLRILAVFSLPDGEHALGLREQRRALADQIHAIRVRHGRAIDLEILHYGATRERLRRQLEHGDGWDVVHFCGHGRLDAVVLEGAGAAPDPVTTDEVVAMLRITRARLKLLVLSSCSSAAAPRADQLAADGGPSSSRLPVLAEQAAHRLGCAVLAMRYRVDDDFSIALTNHLYERMFGSGQSLTRALQLALPDALGNGPTAGLPALSVAIPALFGARCLDLTLRPPAGPPPDFSTAGLTMARFPAEPERVVGRSGPLHRAAAALTRPGHSGVLLTGPAGIGTTTCAVELAYRHEHEFGAHVWYQAPEADQVFPAGVIPFATALDAQVPGLRLHEATADATHLAAYLPRLTELMERNAVLVVIDGIDGLLDPRGGWRDSWWKAVIGALLGHTGYSRVVLTARRVPPGLAGQVHVETLAPLTPRESVLLARQLPTLGAYLKGRTRLPLGTVKATVGATLTRAAGNPAALTAADADLAHLVTAADHFAASHSPASPCPVGHPVAGPVAAEYRVLLDRWLPDTDRDASRQ
jgi:CHAT domain